MGHVPVKKVVPSSVDERLVAILDLYAVRKREARVRSEALPTLVARIR
jgi:hypothetical protein